jgi:phosphoenolpyruvate-protein kinase (PTS system EI component)
VLHLIAHTIQAANRSGTPVAVCGEMAGEPAHAPAARLRPAQFRCTQPLAIKERARAPTSPKCSAATRAQGSRTRQDQELLAKLNS